MFVHEPIKLEYDELKTTQDENGRIYHDENGNKYPSITTVLGILSRDSIAAWKERVGIKEATKIGNRAAKRGTEIHDLMERYINNDEINISKMMPGTKKSFRGLKKILDENLGTVYGQELQLYSEYLGVAGRTDVIGLWNGVRSIIDFKTSLKPKKREWISGYFMQGTAYSIMFEERTGISIPNIHIVMDIDNREPVVFSEHRDNWVKPLMETIAEYNREQEWMVN